LRQVALQVDSAAKGGSPGVDAAAPGAGPRAIVPAPTSEGLTIFPPHYLLATPPEQIADDLVTVQRLTTGGDAVDVRGTSDPNHNLVEYRIVTRDQSGPGLFSGITGALTAKGLQILSANICTASNGI